ncbi:MAG: hypothetical protein V7636_1933 [Actinomycetota bacterium]|jgi:hypothetical protein
MTTPARAVPVPIIAKADATPIACTLGAGEIDVRVAEWRALLATVTSRVDIEDGVRLVLGSDARLDEVARLAAAEYDCCRFFAFAITVDQRGIALEVRAPEGAEELVAELFGSGT